MNLFSWRSPLWATFWLAPVVLLMTATPSEAKVKKLVIAPISEATCKQIRDAVATYGVAIVEAGAAARGYTRAQINQARAYCK